MPDVIAASGTVHWVGAGLSSGSGLKILADHADRLVLWNRNLDRAKQLAARLGIDDIISQRPFKPDSFAVAISEGDVVVSMLPAAQHIELLRLCLTANAHFVCTSYASDALQDAAVEAKAKGLIVMTEAGLDPGIDHLIAHRLIESARREVGTRNVSAKLVSYCGGFPEVPNDFRYRFSWAPVGVLQALRSPACFINGFEERVAARPWEETHEFLVEGEAFEAYPNRDSRPFIEQYNIPSSWKMEEFVRGTLRLSGWCDAWRDVFPVLAHGSDNEVAELGADLARRYPYGKTDNDRVLLFVGVEIQLDGEKIWSGSGKLDLVGARGESAMARSVSLSAACAVMEVLDDVLRPGLHRAAGSGRHSDRWLKRLANWGLSIDIAQRNLASAIAG